MNYKLLIPFLLLVIIASSSCKSTFDTSRPFGVDSKIVMNSKAQYETELILVDSNYVYILVQENLVKLDIRNISLIHAHELEHKNRKLALLWAGISSIGLGVAIEDSGLKYPLFGLGAYALISGFSGMQKYKFKPPLTSRALNKLKLYSRYPQGLTPEQLSVLENYYKKDKSPE